MFKHRWFKDSCLCGAYRSYHVHTTEKKYYAGWPPTTYEVPVPTNSYMVVDVEKYYKVQRDRKVMRGWPKSAPKYDTALHLNDIPIFKEVLPMLGISWVDLRDNFNLFYDYKKQIALALLYCASKELCGCGGIKKRQAVMQPKRALYLALTSFIKLREQGSTDDSPRHC